MSSDQLVLTLDVDWAPDFVIDEVAAVLTGHRVKATWFVTHQSAAIDRLRSHGDLFELGIHPNMLPGSTHGQSEDEVLSHVKEIVPDAVSMRTHGLYQTSTWLAKAARDYAIQIDASLFLPNTDHLAPHQLKWDEADLWRVPYYWEDDMEMFQDPPRWQLNALRSSAPGWKIFNFHPIHVVMNTQSFSTYKELSSQRDLKSWDPAFVRQHTALQPVGRHADRSADLSLRHIQGRRAAPD